METRLWARVGIIVARVDIIAVLFPHESRLLSWLLVLNERQLVLHAPVDAKEGV